MTRRDMRRAAFEAGARRGFSNRATGLGARLVLRGMDWVLLPQEDAVSAAARELQRAKAQLLRCERELERLARKARQAQQ